MYPVAVLLQYLMDKRKKPVVVIEINLEQELPYFCAQPRHETECH